mmetsp:Transcript_71757/g.181307  ORF Transcript_71757/g.181307 Transcript_71757/m.181307 type:complete len:216 (+) Transcript_71757:657-1304(+)
MSTSWTPRSRSASATTGPCSATRSPRICRTKPRWMPSPGAQAMSPFCCASPRTWPAAFTPRWLSGGTPAQLTPCTTTTGLRRSIGPCKILTWTFPSRASSSATSTATPRACLWTKPGRSSRCTRSRRTTSTSRPRWRASSIWRSADDMLKIPLSTWRCRPCTTGTWCRGRIRGRPRQVYRGLGRRWRSRPRCSARVSCSTLSCRSGRLTVAMGTS